MHGLGSSGILKLYAHVRWARTTHVQASVVNALQHRPTSSLRWGAISFLFLTFESLMSVYMMLWTAKISFSAYEMFRTDCSCFLFYCTQVTIHIVFWGVIRVVMWSHGPCMFLLTCYVNKGLTLTHSKQSKFQLLAMSQPPPLLASESVCMMTGIYVNM